MHEKSDKGLLDHGARRIRRRSRIRRRRVHSGVGLVLALGLVLVPFTSADALVAWNGARAVTVLHHRYDVDVSFQIRTGRGPGVAVANTAFALSAFCNHCHTAAIAVQIDLVAGNVVGVDARNRAEARNWNCIACDTLASAEQFVISPGTDIVRLTPQGMRDLRMVEWQLRMLVHSGQSAQQMQPSVDALMNRIVQVLQTEIVVGSRSSGPATAAPAAPATAPMLAAPQSAAPQSPATPTVTVQRTGGTVVAQGPNDAQHT
jgi:hypothetical protein